MKKRGFVSLFIVSIVAIAAVVGVVFAFKNAGRQKDIYANSTVTVDKPNINLEIELERDPTADKKFYIKETELSSATFTITVGGLPSTADRGVDLNESSISNGIVTVTKNTSDEDAQKTGSTTFTVTGKNGGAPVTMTFTTRSSGQTVAVNVTVNLVAKDMKIAPQAHFGIRQGGSALDLLSADVLSKYTFYAHPDDDERSYTPNKFPVEYRLKQDYLGVELEQGMLKVTEQAVCVDQYIILQAKLPAMTEWLDVPFYVFPAVNKILVETDAYKAETTAAYDNIWDLVANRTEASSANFTFALDCGKSERSDYGFEVKSADTTMVRVDMVDNDLCRRSLSTAKNLGEVAINITAYPIVKVDGKEIYFNDTSDANVQIRDTIYIRVRNEFYLDEETEIYGSESFNLAPSKKTLDAFYYESNQGGYASGHYDVFSLDTGNGKTVNADADIEFELEVVDSNPNGKSGIYGWDARNNPGNISLYDILQIGYWSNTVDDWIMLSGTADNYYTHYLNRFSVAFAQTSTANDFLGSNITSLTLRVKSLYELTVKGKATCDIQLEATSAIDQFEVDNLTQFDDGTFGVALVYNTKFQSFSMAEVDVYGKYAMVDAENNVSYVYSRNWNTAKVSDNSDQLPFKIDCDRSVPFENEFGVAGYYHLRYYITANNIGLIEYYKNYPMTIEYTNGKSYTFYIRVYPTVEALSMSVVSSSKGKIYQTITDRHYSNYYDYVRTVYVRKGFTYEFAIDTPGANVGAYAVFNKIKDANGNVISGIQTNMIDARALPEGLYECQVSLHAYSDAVYAENETEITVYVIVVDPVGNVTLPLNVNLDGLTDHYEITLEMTTLDGKVITDDNYLHVEVAPLNNKYVTVKPGSAKNKFIITAQYLSDETFSVGFKVYKRYEFYTLNGQVVDDAPFEFDYIAGNPVSTNVTITHERPNSLTLTNGVNNNNNGLGDYVELVSTTGAMTSAKIGFKTAEDADYKDVGIAFAKWKNGKFELAPFTPMSNNLDLQIDNVATARIDLATNQIYVTPTTDRTSLGDYALVIYPRDSIRYVSSVDGVDLVLPDQYKIVTLYIGSATEIKDTIDELESNRVHDANSGKRNNRGGYNWIIPSQNGSLNAVLFYTENSNQFDSQINANVYYLDDLSTVLGWVQFNANSFWLSKHVISNGVTRQIGNTITLNCADGRLALDMNHIFSIEDNGANYSDKDTTVYYQLTALDGTGASMAMRFYAVKSLDTFEVSIRGVGDNSWVNGLVSRKNLSPNEYTNTVDRVTIQRGNGFEFYTNLDSNYGWQLNNVDFDDEEANKTNSVSYAGGTYSFYPYLEFTRAGSSKDVFNLDALTATVNVNVRGGINYLNLAQDAVTLDGVTTATYDLTMRVDQANWSVDLLTYNFLYDGVYYQLFKDGQTISYVNMEGGKAKLEFKLSCLNASNPVYSNFYYTYYLKIEVAVVIIAPDVDPFYDISGARLWVQENLAESPLLNTKTPVSDSAAFNLYKQGIYNLSMAHFADTSTVEGNKSALTLATGQTDAGVIYLDEDSAGGILVVYPTPYYINVVDINLWTSQVHTEDVLIGTDLAGNPIYDKVTYSVGFVQMIYNETEKYYQPYLSTGNTPKMVSSWSAAEGYKWNGRYYFKTYILCDTQVSHRLANGTRFGISVSIQGENNAKPIVGTMTLDAKYRDSFVIDPDDETEDYAVCTMTQTQYQALGTTAVYDVAFPSDCVPNYANFTFNGVDTTTTTIESTYATVTINTVAQTLSVYLKADAAAIGETLEVRIPYRRPGDYVNPYLSVVIVPVYFEFDSLEVIGHYETRLQLATRDELTQLKYRGLFNYDSSLSNSNLTEKMTTFNQSLQTSNLLSCNYETAGQVTVEIAYSYIGGVPVLTKNGTCRYARTFNYDVVETKPIVKRTEYLAVGTASTYTFYNWDSLHATKLYIPNNNDANYAAKFWDYDIKTQDRNNVVITISLENRSTTVTNHDAYQALINAGKIVINVYSTADNTTPQLELTIIPVYFTFTDFKLQNNPVKPLVALTTPTSLTVEAGGIVCAEDSAVTNAINAFNTELLNAQSNLANSMVLAFNRVPNDDGILNFNFDPSTRAITRADSAEPITATSYLLITAGITYVNGVPTLSRNGNQISTYLPVRTFGSDTGDNGDSNLDLPTAPNGRTRTVAQAVGTTVRYNLALTGVVYDSLLDKYEIRTDGNYVWDRDAGWNAVFDVKNSTVSVTLDPNTDLFDKVLVIMAYNQEGKLMYALNIIPAYFTVEQILLADHLDEVPVMIQTGVPSWLSKLQLDFASSYSSHAFDDFDYDSAMNEFLMSLNSSGLVSRIDDAGFITLLAGIDYDGGVPHLVNLVNCMTTIQNSYRYIMINGTPENTKAQALGQEVIYSVNRTFQSIKYSTGKDAAGNEIWQTFVRDGGAEWWVDRDATNARRIKVTLTESTNLIGKVIRIGVFVNDSDAEPAYILNVIPAYFTVEDLTLMGQNSEDHDIRLYYGEEPDSPADVVFDAIFGKYSANASLNIPPRLSVFTNDLQNAKTNLIGRYFDTDLMAGDLHITVYLDYQNGEPTLVASSAAGSAFVIRLDVDFTYTIYGKPAVDDEYPPMPTGPRTRTEVQAVGTTSSYTIDLGKAISMNVEDLMFDDTKLQERGWKVTFEDNVVTVELLPTAADILLANDIVLNFYSGYDLVFVLTIQPVLFEVVGIETAYPEQPVNLVGVKDVVQEVDYRAIVKYNAAVTYDGNAVINYIESFNSILNAAKGGLVEIEKENQYLKVDIAVDYGAAGSVNRRVPALLNVENYPLNVVESYIEYSTLTQSSAATHYQAIGTTEYYQLGIEYAGATLDEIHIYNGDDTEKTVSDEYLTAAVLPYGDSYALKVCIQPNSGLLENRITFTLKKGEKTFTMTVKPVWFVVEGFDVINHPERHMWLIVSDKSAEKVSDLLFRIRARYTTLGGSELQKAIQTQIDVFNQQLAYAGQGWTNDLETYTIGSKYLVVRAAIAYSKTGIASIVNFDTAKPTQVVRDVFEYARYSDRVDGNGMAYPNIPRSRTVELTIGYDASYTLDLPNLPTGFSDEMISLYENYDANNADDDSKLKPYVNNSGAWTVQVRGNQLYVALKPDADLVNRELKVFIYHTREHTADAPNSYDATNVAFILTIRPVWFKVTGITLTGYPNDTIYVDSINTFMSEITKIDSGKNFVPVFEYSDTVLNQTENGVGANLQTLMDNFTANFLYSPYVSKTRIREDANTYHFQVTTAVSYVPYQGTAVLTNEVADRIWQTFKIVVKDDGDTSAEDQVRIEHQGIGTTKTYYLDDSVMAGVASISNGTNYTVTWDVNHRNYVTVELASTATIDTPVEIVIGANFTLKIYPVYYEIMGFETVQHPERPVWIIAPQSTADLQYRVITSDLTKLPNNILATVQVEIDALNQSLNNGMAPVSITLDSNQYIIFDAAVNYKADGYPEIVAITQDRRNVVESIIPFRVWSNTQRPKPEHPTVMSTATANQIIGSTKLYTLKNIKGQTCYQYLWVENAGSLVTSFDNSANGTMQTYKGLSVLVDPSKNTLQIQLAADTAYLTNTIRVYIPYSTTVNGKEVWYSHCIEITPLLFELTGWTIEGVGTTELVKDEVYDDYLLLTINSDPVTVIKYVARIKAAKTNDENLLHAIEVAKKDLENRAVDYLKITDTANVTLTGNSLRRNVAAELKTDNRIGFSTYIVYENGVPKLVESSKTLVTNQILVSTGYDKDDWLNNKVGKVELSAGAAYAVQAVGTSAVYLAEIPNAAKIFTDQITVIDQLTQKPITIPGERVNLVTYQCEVADNDTLAVMLSVDLAPVIALCNTSVEVRIPYATDANATEPNYYYAYCITPVMFLVDGFYLDNVEDNDLALTDREVALELRVKATYSDDIAVRNMVNLALNSFESSVNNAIRNGTLQFEVVNESGGVNIRLESYGNTVWIQKIGDKTALNYINSAIQIGYSNGVPKLDHVNPLTDAVINLHIQVSTQQGETNYFPGWTNITLGNTSQFLQAIGTSRNYPLEVSNMNVVFYYEYIQVFNGGLKRGPNEYEFFAYDVLNPGRQRLTLNFTLRASARNLNDWIDVRIPYTTFVEGKIVWNYYSLQIKPVLFEIRDWKLKVGDELVDSVTLDNSAVELYFSPEVISGPLNQSYYSFDELYYINSAIKRLETEINTYDPKISDGYTYMVINNTAQEGHQVNYTVYRDNSTNLSYLVRDTADASTTIMQVSANIAYGVSDFSKEYVEGAQAVTAYSNTTDARRIMSQISINTTEKSAADSADDRSTVYITQENASRLMNLSSGVDYILMSDIKLYQITELNNGAWQPANFPSNATLDGNNYKIFFNSAGFDLSSTPSNIGLFTTIPAGSVVKNLQIVLEHGTSNAPITTLEVNLKDYQNGSINVGMLAGVNYGIVTNCAVLSEWQFDMQNLTELVNPVTGTNFENALPFNKDGYVFDDNYFYEIGLDDDNQPVVTNVYNRNGYGVTKNDLTGKWDQVVYDIYMNVAHWITPDRTNVACYDNYSAIVLNENLSIDSQSLARFYVYANNENLNVTLGGLVGTNAYMMTNSRVLIDVELYGPEHRTETGAMDEISILSSAVGGVAGINGGTITTTYFRDGNVINNANANTLQQRTSLLGGFVGQNNGTIQQCYAMGRSIERQNNLNYTSVAGAVKTIRNSLGGFVHVNNGTITDCMVNMVIWKTGTEGSVGGFVYQNTDSGRISNCIENNYITSQSGGTLDYYAPFVKYNGNTDTNDKVSTANLSNLIYAGNAESISISDDWGTTLKRLNNNSNAKYSDINNYAGFSIGQAQNDDGEWGITPNNTIWMMTDVGPMLRAANDIAISFRKYSWNSSPYLYNPGTAKNPYLVWNADQFNDYVYAATAQATEADKGAESAPLTDIETSRQNNHLRLVDNVTLDGIKDTYKIVYTGTFDGNGLTMSGISLDTVANDLATMGLFGKTEYATIRNINFEIGNINSTARYVGGIAGIAINTNFVDVCVTGNQVIKGANIVGGFVGLNVVNDSRVENYNLSSSVSVTANFHNQQSDIGAEPFSSGIEYYQQTLYAKVEALGITYEQGFGTAGGVFGFITSNPNNYRVVDDQGNATIYSREFNKEIILRDGSGKILGQATRSSQNSEADWFLKDRTGKVIDDTVMNGKGVYYTDQIILRNVSGATKDVSANVAGGLIGIMDETIELRKPSLTSLGSLTGKYYLGGLVGINLGKISGDVTQNADGTTSTYSTMDLSQWTVLSSAGSSYVFRDGPANETAKRFWGMTVGGVAGYNDGFSTNLNSGVIENINISVNVLAPSSSRLQYVIGGVVGANGDYGSVNNAHNTHNNINRYIQVNSTQAQNIGFYYGRIIGRNSLTTSSFTGDITTRMKTLQLDFPYFGNQSYVSATDFATTDYSYEGIENAFGIVGDTTFKKQTMTLEEYRAYLASVITTLDLVGRVEMLEPWLRSLPTTITTDSVNGQTVRVETYAPDAIAELVKWIDDNGIFETWNYDHRVLQGKAMRNYESYIEYSAVSTKASNVESENDFVKNIEKYRALRFAKAQKLFTYQYQVTTSNQTLAGPQNADFTWRQYEDYLLLVQNATDRDMTATEYTNAYRNFAAKYGEKLANLVYPYGLIGEYKDGKVMINSHADMLGLYAEVVSNPDAKPFTNQDPLQLYLNYVVETSKDTNAFQVSNGWKMSLAQYYYYMTHIYGHEQVYNGTTYKVPADFAVTGNEGYVSYLYLNSLLESSSGQLLTVPEYIDMIKREQEIVMQNETAWVKTGHLAANGGGGTRISDIGALTLNWVTDSDQWTKDAKDQVVAENGVVVWLYNHQWSAIEEYLNAKSNLGLTIAKYKEMIGMGGSLYHLIHNYSGANATDTYIFALKSEQYHWTPAQINFIRQHFNNNGTYDLQSALSATTYGNVLSIASNGNVRAVYKTDAQMVVNNEWFTDNDSNSTYTDGEPLGVWYLTAATNNSVFVNGDGMQYTFYRSSLRIELSENTLNGVGAAMYIDTDGNKLFGTAVHSTSGGGSSSHSAGNDILLIYALDNPDLDNANAANFPDFYRDVNNTRTYYKIARQILPNEYRIVTTKGNNASDASGNYSDYLEEILWWLDKGFSAEQFDQIKAHAMTQSVPEDARVDVDDKVYTTRKTGYTLADDWAVMDDKQQVVGGFKSDQFDPSEYIAIVNGAQYVDDTWYSTYADYLWFCKLNNIAHEGTTSINPNDIGKMLPAGTEFISPLNQFSSINFIQNLASENELAEAIEFDSDHNAFMTLFETKHNTADYITWAKNYNYNINQSSTRYFRLNHYIYYVKHDLENSPDFEPSDFRWVLDQTVRVDIFYETVTQENRTKDLVTYRREWFNKGGTPFITYRDYCEWINIYQYNDEYRAARGDFEDEDSDEAKNPGNGWLTLDAFAVWKRMEKYENNVEYLAKIGNTTGQEPITAPILKRQISTTVFPKIFSSGEQTTDPATGLVTDDHYTLPQIVKPEDQFPIYYYRWGTIDNYADNILRSGVRGFATGTYDSVYDKPMDSNHQRDAWDRYEYNERYNVWEVYRGIDVKKYNDKGYISERDDSSKFMSLEKLYQNATKYINDPKFAKDCDDDCGGKNDIYNCKDPTHARYQIRRWEKRYGCFIPKVNGKDELSKHVILRLDEYDMTDNNNDPIDHYPHDNKYVQLYVPYNYFEKACKMIKSVYSSSNNYAGYRNYMKYWAKNGNPDWICNTEEYDGYTSNMKIVNKTYLVTNFWNNYDGTRSPVDGAILSKKANGF